MKHWKNRSHAFMDEAGNEGGGAGGAAPAPAAAAPAASAPAPAPAPAAAPAAADPASLLQQGDGHESGTDYFPEKFRVAKDDGTIDVEASARKLAASYGELEKTRPTSGVPKTVDEYKIEGLPEGVNFEEIKTDPVFQGFLKGGHAKGISNDQMSYVLDEYFKLAPDLLAANQVLGAAAAKTELAKVWTGGDQEMTQNLGLAMRAVKSYGAEGDVPGGLDRLMQKYGNDPDFLAFAAAIGREVQEDVPLRIGTSSAEDWDAQVAAIKANPAYANAEHPEHTIVMKKMDSLYQRRYPNQPQKLAGGATR